ncbi:MAG: pilus assembly PilX N-terminal domain-containing protein [Candidatus Omnitrophota bacterium]|jgi:Tfp pilus assembly protein PilX
MRGRGFALIITFVFMTALAVMTMAIVSMVSSNTRSAGFQLDDAKALYLAQAGVDNILSDVRAGRPVAAVPAPIPLGDGTVEYVAVTRVSDTLTIDVRGKMPLDLPATGKEIKARLVAVYTDDGSGKFLACSSWKESYEQ